MHFDTLCTKRVANYAGSSQKFENCPARATIFLKPALVEGFIFILIRAFI